MAFFLGIQMSLAETGIGLGCSWKNGWGHKYFVGLKFDGKTWDRLPHHDRDHALRVRGYIMKNLKIEFHNEEFFVWMTRDHSKIVFESVRNLVSQDGQISWRSQLRLGGDIKEPWAKLEMVGTILAPDAFPATCSTISVTEVSPAR